jgi:hypothetical protein
VNQAVVAAEFGAPSRIPTYAAVRRDIARIDVTSSQNWEGPFVGVPREPPSTRRCGNCCTGTWPHDMGSTPMCNGTDADGQLALIRCG